MSQSTTPVGEEQGQPDLVMDEGRFEHCPACDEETIHTADIQLRLESESRGDQNGHGHQPYRVATCTDCGHEKEQRA